MPFENKYIYIKNICYENLRDKNRQSGDTENIVYIRHKAKTNNEKTQTRKQQ